MIWDTTYPPDSLAANTIDHALRNSKVLIRERAVVFNGSWNEHSFFGASATGTHPLSQVGWVQIHPDYATMVAGGPYVVGSLHYAISSGLYVVDTDQSFKGLTVIDHSKLIIDSTDFHTQYYRKDGTRPMLTELRMDVPAVEVLPQTNPDSPMPASHDALDWFSAHGVDAEYLINRHFVNASVGVANKQDLGTISGNNALFSDGGNADSKFFGFPAVLGSGGSYTSSTAVLLQLASAHGGVGLVATFATTPASASGQDIAPTSVIP